jgi:hypothetical protein
LKGKTTCCLAILAICWASRARADDRVLLLTDSAEPRPGLLSALRIQLMGACDVASREAPAVPSVAARVAAMTELAERERALLVVRAEGPLALGDGSQEAVLYMVGQRKGRALLEVVRVPGNSGPDLDRTLALKVREAVDELHRSAAGSPSDAMLGLPADASAVMDAHGPTRWGGVLGLGVVGGPQSGATFGQWGPQLHVGPALLAARLRLSMLLVLGWFPSLEARRADASVRVSEVAPELALHAQLRQRGLWLGARTGLALALVHATGRNGAGAQGEAHEQLPSWQLAVDAELPLVDGLSLDFEVGLQTWLRRQRFAVDAMQVLDLGRLRPLARLALVFSTEAVR